MTPVLLLPWLLLAEAAVSDNHSEVSPYATARAKLLATEAAEAVGGGLQLSPAELAAEKVLLAARAADEAAARAAGLPPIAGIHFFEARGVLERGRLLPLIRKMPKGAALHLHSDSMVPAEWLVANVTYEPDLWLCGSLNGSHLISFRFAASSGGPALPCGAAGWQRVSDLRRSAKTAGGFDAALLRELTVVVAHPEIAYPTVDAIWTAFQRCIEMADGLVFYDPVWTRYVRRGLETFRDDGVQHVELRQVYQGDIGRLYALNGSLLPALETFARIGQVATELVGEGLAAASVGAATSAISTDAAAALTSQPPPPPPPAFTGALAISCGLRFLPVANITAALAGTMRLMAALPEVVVGFDLVGQEDPGRPLVDFAAVLAAEAGSVPYFFHAGETKQIGGPADENLVDAVLLNATRIGHGFALGHHPELTSEVEARSIGVEVCPISNQVLGLVSDLANHPVVDFAGRGMPITINPDDPGIWGATGSSHDWAMSFHALGDRAGLAMLKQLAINSLEHSALGDSAKLDALAIWQKSWNAWVDTLVSAAP